VRDDLTIHPEALVRRIDDDRRAGLRPFLLVGNAGSVSTGAVDPLPRLAEIARAHDLWFHVDGAYGAPAVLCEEAPADLNGLALADSVAVDPHKWLYSAVEAGCALVRHPGALHDTFSYTPPYYRFDGEEEDPRVNYYERGPQNSRGFRALKVWLGLRQAGVDGYRRMIGDDIRLSRALQRAVEAEPRLEAWTQGLSITTFRYVPAGVKPGTPDADAYLDRLNEELLHRLKASGLARAHRGPAGRVVPRPGHASDDPSTCVAPISTGSPSSLLTDRVFVSIYIHTDAVAFAVRKRGAREVAGLPAHDEIPRRGGRRTTMSKLPLQLSQASGVPFYRQIVDQMSELIRAGQILPDMRLPSFRELAPQLLVSLITVRRAYADLEAAGLIVRRQGEGTFVASDVQGASRRQALGEARAQLEAAVTRARQLGLDGPALRGFVLKLLASAEREERRGDRAREGQGHDH